MDDGTRDRRPTPADDWFSEPDAAQDAAGAPRDPAPPETLPLCREDAPVGEHGRGRRFAAPGTIVVYSPAEPPKPETSFRVPVKTLVFMGAAAVGFYLIWPQLIGFWDAMPGLRAITWWWFALMIVLEAGSFICYWGMMRVTLDESRWFVLATTQLSSNAFARIVPGGAASGGTVSYQMLAAAGEPRGRIVTGLATNTLLSNGVLFLLPVMSLPAILGGAPINTGLMHTLLIGLVLFVLIVVGGVLALFTDRVLVWVGEGIGWVLDRVKKADAPRADMPARLLKERDFIKASLGDRWWQALGCAAGNWLLDFAALLAALAAVGAQPRPSLVLVAYVVAMILAWIPITPGGLGFVEVGLVAALGLAGVGGGEATTAALAYRLVSFWLPIPAGAVAGALFRHRFAGQPSAEAGS